MSRRRVDGLVGDGGTIYTLTNSGICQVFDTRTTCRAQMIVHMFHEHTIETSTTTFGMHHNWENSWPCRLSIRFRRDRFGCGSPLQCAAASKVPDTGSDDWMRPMNPSAVRAVRIAESGRRTRRSGGRVCSRDTVWDTGAGLRIREQRGAHACPCSERFHDNRTALEVGASGKPPRRAHGRRRNTGSQIVEAGETCEIGRRRYATSGLSMDRDS